MKIIHCIKCEKDKPLSEFYANFITRNVHRCIKCHRKDVRLRNKTLNGRYSKYKSEAKRRGLYFRISRERFARLTSSPCFYCGKYTHPELKINGVDRVKSNRSYVAQNCVSCCFPCNRSKSDQQQDKFIGNSIERGEYLKKMKRAA